RGNLLWLGRFKAKYFERFITCERLRTGQWRKIDCSEAGNNAREKQSTRQAVHDAQTEGMATAGGITAVLPLQPQVLDQPLGATLAARSASHGGPFVLSAGKSGPRQR